MRNTHKQFLLLLVMTASFLFSSESHAWHWFPSGVDKGVDHATVLVREENFDDSRLVLSEDLGFSVAPTLASPVGTQNNLIWFPDLTYLEWATVIDDNPFTAPFVDFLDEHEGGKFIAIDVQDATSWSSYLTGKGYTNSGPIPALPLFYEPTSALINELPLWESVLLAEPVAPDDSLFFIDYDEALVQQMFVDFPLLAPSQHANTAQSLETVYIVVDDMEAAISFYKGLGLPVLGRNLKVPYLGGKGPWVFLPNNAIRLLEPYKTGVVEDFAATRGEGVLGARVRVANLNTARNLIAANTGEPLPVITYLGRKRFIIPPTLTNDFLIEMIR